MKVYFILLFLIWWNASAKVCEAAGHTNENSKADIEERLAKLERYCERNMRHFQASLDALKGQQHKCCQASGEFVGFMARTTAERFYAPGDTLIFDEEVLDPSNSYNSTRGVFTCPYSGYYDFKVIVAGTQDAETNEWRRIDGGLYINGQYAVIKAFSTEIDQHSQSSISGVFRCEIGEEVYVVLESPGESNRGLSSGPHTAFAGYLIRMDV